MTKLCHVIYDNCDGSDLSVIYHENTTYRKFYTGQMNVKNILETFWTTVEIEFQTWLISLNLE